SRGLRGGVQLRLPARPAARPALPRRALPDLHHELVPGRRRRHARLPPPGRARGRGDPGPGRGGASPGAAGVKVELDEVAFAYDGGAEVLAGVSFAMTDGGITVVIGPPGSGQPT